MSHRLLMELIGVSVLKFANMTKTLTPSEKKEILEKFIHRMCVLEGS